MRVPVEEKLQCVFRAIAATAVLFGLLVQTSSQAEINSDPGTPPGVQVDAFGSALDEAIELAIEDIQITIEGGIPSEDAAKKLEEAQAELEKALAAEAEGDVKKALDEMAHAAHKLQEAADKGADVQVVIDYLVAHAFSLADTTIDIACDTLGSDPDKIAKAEEESAKAQEELEKVPPHFDHAVEHYAKAWEEARKAVSLKALADTVEDLLKEAEDADPVRLAEIEDLIDEIVASARARAVAAIEAAQEAVDEGEGDQEDVDKAWEELAKGDFELDVKGHPHHAIEFYTKALNHVGGPDAEVMTNPEDTDDDGLLDEWEIEHFGDITSQDGTGDPDGDGLTNLQEFNSGTDPNNGGGGTDPTQPDAEQPGTGALDQVSLVTYTRALDVRSDWGWSSWEGTSFSGWFHELPSVNPYPDSYPDPYPDPYAVDPYAVDPYAVDPYAVDPYAVDPYAVDPYAVDPYADHYVTYPGSGEPGTVSQTLESHEFPDSPLVEDDYVAQQQASAFAKHTANYYPELPSDAADHGPDEELVNVGEIEYEEVNVAQTRVWLMREEPSATTVSRSFLRVRSSSGGTDPEVSVETLTIEPNQRFSSTYVDLVPNLPANAPRAPNWIEEYEDEVIQHHHTDELRLLPMEVVPDYNRDGVIDDKDRGKVTEQNPWRWWINDDNDLPTAERGTNEQDIPKQNASVRDCKDLAVDGMRDLIDFFPLHLDLKRMLEVLPENQYKYFLKHEEEALKFYEYAGCSIDGSDPGHFPNRHVKLVEAGRGLASKDLKLASTHGSELSSNMLLKAKEGKGVVVIEGAKKTQKPLVLEIIKKSDNSSIAKIEFPVRIVDVEDMYRHVNMRDITGGSGGHTTQTGEPSGYPDDLTNGKFVAYVHGFKVSAESARGSQSNIFKRLHHMGSKACYIGVSWFGDPPNPGVNLVLPPDYHRAVYSGLTTGIAAKGRLGFTQNSSLTVLAHSLGNSVVSSAIANHGLKVDQYYIINGAIPLQAYDSSQTSNSSGHHDMNRNMTEDDWKPYYDHKNGEQQRLFAANWHDLFDPPDNRSKLTWKNLFAKPELLGVAYNFYSPTDEVVENPDETEEFGHWTNVWAAVNGGRHAWVQQEIGKGGQNILIPASFHDINGGWQFNSAWNVFVPTGNGGHYRRRKPVETAGITNEQLKTEPFHRLFLYPDLYDQAQGSATAGATTHRYKLLGTGIPATSYAIAANRLDYFEDTGNFNMPRDLKSPGGYNSWPAHENGVDPDDWMHSDFKDVALHFLHPMYQKMIELAELDKN